MTAITVEKPFTVDFTEEAKLLQVLPNKPVLSSHAAGWRGIHLEYHRQPPHETPEHCPAKHFVSISTHPEPFHSERRLDGRLQIENRANGEVAIVPANVRHQCFWNQQVESILISIDRDRLTQVAHDLIDPDAVELMPQFARPDPLIHQLGVSLKAELEISAITSRLYADSITTLLCVHLLQHYCVRKPLSSDASGGLPKLKRQQVIDYIHTHLDRNLSLDELAAVVQISPHHFSRLFKQSTGLSPHQFVIRRRVEWAKQLLLQGGFTVTEIAAMVGFYDQSHFAHHFRRLMGVAPKALLKK